MALILPPLAFLLFYLILRAEQKELQEALLGAAVFSGTAVVVTTETLSVSRSIDRGNLTLCWLVICVASYLYLRVLRKKNGNLPKGTTALQHSIDTRLKLLLGMCIAIAFVIGILAFLAPPSMWDAMLYHLPRVTMWMSNHSVRFYPTPDYSQLIFAPWAEYAMMQIHLLWGTDRFVNFVEFFSFIGCAVAASWLAKLMGASVRGQALAVVFSMTIPEGILEASGPANTYVAAFWIATTVAFLIRWNESPSWFNTMCIGLSAGIALLTKGTAYVYLPFLVLSCWWMGSRSTRLLFLKRCAVLALLVVAVNAPQAWRCFDLTGSPLGLPFADGGPRLRWSVDRVTVRGTIANVLRNGSLHIFTPSEGINSRINRGIRLAIKGIGAAPDDPRMVWAGYTFQTNHFSLAEVHAGNPLHFVLLACMIAFVLSHRKRAFKREALCYAAGIVLAALLFCAMLRWQPWEGRHHLPLFVLGAALFGLVLDKCFSRNTGTIICAVLLLYAMPFVVLNRTRSLIPWHKVDDIYHPRPVLYFNDQHEAYAGSAIAAAQAVNELNCYQVAFDSFQGQPDSQLNSEPKSFFIYPFFALIHADARSRTVWYTGVHNLSARYAGRQPHGTACAVVCLECVKVSDKWNEYRKIGPRASVFGDIVVFSALGQRENTEAMGRAFSAKGDQ